MKPAFYKLPDHYRGDIFEGRTFTVESRDTEEDPYLPVDLTGANVVMQVRYGSTRGEVVLEYSLAGGELVISDAVGGKINMYEVETDIELPGLHFYDLQVTLPGEKIKTYVRGTWNIIDDVTRLS